MHNITIQSKSTVSSVRQVRAALTQSQLHTLHFLHAWSGCVIVSRPYGVGKATALKCASKLERQAEIFARADSTNEESTRQVKKPLYTFIMQYHLLPWIILGLHDSVRKYQHHHSISNQSACYLRSFHSLRWWKCMLPLKEDIYVC